MSVKPYECPGCRVLSDQLKAAEMAIEYWTLGLNVEVTCLKCGANKTCEFAWDPYNTDGDCLAGK